MYAFGKGTVPKRNSIAVIMENYASQLARHYGTDLVSDVMTHSHSDLHLDMSNDPSHIISQAEESTPYSAPPLRIKDAAVNGSITSGIHSHFHPKHALDPSEAPAQFDLAAACVNAVGFG
ncbi:hypothetical protein BDN72DRAFT_862652 [Pluteus cervinus]|uniref:Uncharacterized protein n=1 Tax=Pluteus cervinus TaxID=181527 RepID=A0ACD3AAK4_9AGAR|nr:hypothetical protein BDN72DRAFT_862652 [Pluteus cervinus]